MALSFAHFKIQERLRADSGDTHTAGVETQIVIDMKADSQSTVDAYIRSLELLSC